MPAQPSSSSTPSKPTTRSSIRHSLGLAGKALADVINKDSGRDQEKVAKKGTKDTSSRRLSAVNAKPAAPRASMGDANRPPSTASRRTMTPDSKTVTRRSSLSMATAKLPLDEQPRKSADATAPQGAGVVRSASLRPRPGVSALPKYRPKSIVGESAKPPSPAKAGVRRRLSTSDDEKEEGETSAKESAAERSLRPISPLPQRAAFKLINAANTTADSAKTKATPSPSSKGRVSSARPTKTVKTVASSNPTIPRPSSSASSSSSFTPRTPKSPAAKTAVGLRRQNKASSNQSSPLRDSSPARSHTESPLARHSRKASQPSVPVEFSEVGNMSHISEGSHGEDSEAELVELLLAPVAAPGAPTPAMPRVINRSRRYSKATAPKTPSRSQLPSRANLSYLSPLPPDSDSPASLRPQQASGGTTAGRGSILSWEQLATEASRTLGEDEIASMLSDIPPPFRGGAISPNQRLEIPESPCLSALNSPGEFGSISQVLLPDVTPSPAVYANASTRYNARDPDVPAVDAAIVTLLRLQLASAESIAKERLYQMQAMEEEIHNLKQVRAMDAEELAKQVGFLEDELRGTLEMRERAEEDRSAHIASLEEQLRQVSVSQDAIAQTRESARAEADSRLKVHDAKASAACSALVAGTQWAFVRDFAESELDAIKGDKEVLAALLADLDEVQRRICL